MNTSLDIYAYPPHIRNAIRQEREKANAAATRQSPVDSKPVTTATAGGPTRAKKRHRIEPAKHKPLIDGFLVRHHTKKRVVHYLAEGSRSSACHVYYPAATSTKWECVGCLKCLAVRAKGRGV